VSESTEATHYQIELTSRQVLAALVVLLVCLFAAFFAGVWIGRNAEASSAAHTLASVDEVSRGGERFDFFGKTGDGEDAKPGGRGAAGSDRGAGAGEDLSASPTAAPAGQADLGPDPDDSELEGDQSAITDANPDALFHDEDTAAAGKPPAPGEKGARAARRRQAREERAKAAAEKAASAQQGAAQQSSAASPPVKNAAAATASTATGGPATAGGPAASAPASASAATAADKTAAAEKTTPADKTAASSDALHIQVLATADQSKAQALVARLTGAGFKTYIAPSNEGGRTVYRVRVGPITDRAVATKQAQELKSRWGLDSWISPGVP
jgi:cell division septation protein DedD